MYPIGVGGTLKLNFSFAIYKWFWIVAFSVYFEANLSQTKLNHLDYFGLIISLFLSSCLEIFLNTHYQRNAGTGWWSVPCLSPSMMQWLISWEGKSPYLYPDKLFFTSSKSNLYKILCTLSKGNYCFVTLNYKPNSH